MKAVLQHHVLVLNRLWQAVNVCTVERAMTLLCGGHAQVVLEHGGEFNTFSFGEFDRLPTKEVKFTRHNVFARDRNTCQYCGHKFDRRDLNIDHIVPRQRGGLTTWTNVVCSCVECNRRKGSRSPEESGLRLIRKPKKPRWRPFVEIQFAVAADHSWRHFLDLAYWNVELGED